MGIVTHRCTEPGCTWRTSEPVKRIAEAAATWHVYREHPGTWRQVVGDRPPRDPDPGTAEGRASLATVAGTN